MDVERAGPTPMWIKIQEGYLRSKESQMYTRPPAQDSSARKINSHNSDCENHLGLSWWRRLLEP